MQYFNSICSASHSLFDKVLALAGGKPDAPCFLTHFSLSHLKMDSFLSASAVRYFYSVEGESVRSQFLNGSNMTVRDPCVVCLVVVPLYVILLVFTVSILSLVIAAKALPHVIRFVLVNILFANFTAGLGILVIILARVIMTRVPRFSQTEESCKFLIAFISVGGTSRPLIMGVYAVVVCIIIMKSIGAVKFKFLSICMLAMWLVCVVFSSTLLFPGVLKVSTLQGTGCVPHAGPYGLVYTVPFFACFLLIPFSLTAVILITVICYVKSNTVSEHAASLRPLLKFSTFLLLGNLLGVIGQSTPVIAAYVLDSPTPKLERAINRTNGIIILLSLVPTPILILVYFKPVRDLLKMCFLRACRNVRGKTFTISHQRHLVDQMLLS